MSRFGWSLFGFLLLSSHLFAQIQHFPSVFEAKFEPAQIQENNISEVRIYSQLSRHPDSVKKVFIGHPDLRFEKQLYEKYTFDSAGRILTYVPYWDSTHTGKRQGGNEVDWEVNYPEVSYEYDGKGRVIEEQKIVKHLRWDTSRTRYYYLEDTAGRLISHRQERDLSGWEINFEYDESGTLKSKTQTQSSGYQTHTLYEWVPPNKKRITLEKPGCMLEWVETYNAYDQIVCRSKTQKCEGSEEIKFPLEVFIHVAIRQLVRHHFPMAEGVQFYGTWPEAEENLSYDRNDCLTKRIFKYGPWINEYSYSYFK